MLIEYLGSAEEFKNSAYILLVNYAGTLYKSQIPEYTYDYFSESTGVIGRNNNEFSYEVPDDEVIRFNSFIMYNTSMNPIGYVKLDSVINTKTYDTEKIIIKLNFDIDTNTIQIELNLGNYSQHITNNSTTHSKLHKRSIERYGYLSKKPNPTKFSGSEKDGSIYRDSGNLKIDESLIYNPEYLVTIDDEKPSDEILYSLLDNLQVGNGGLISKVGTDLYYAKPTEPEIIKIDNNNFNNYRRTNGGVANTKGYSKIDKIDGDSINVVTDSFISSGFNLWDEEWEIGAYDTTTGNPIQNQYEIRCKNPISVQSDEEYYICNEYDFILLFYDQNDEFLISRLGSGNSIIITPSDSRYMRFYMESHYGTEYNNDICINISNPLRNGYYEPYWKDRVNLNIRNLSYIDGTKLKYITSGLGNNAFLTESTYNTNQTGEPGDGDTYQLSSLLGLEYKSDSDGLEKVDSPIICDILYQTSGTLNFAKVNDLSVDLLGCNIIKTTDGKLVSYSIDSTFDKLIIQETISPDIRFTKNLITNEISMYRIQNSDDNITILELLSNELNSLIKKLGISINNIKEILGYTNNLLVYKNTSDEIIIDTDIPKFEVTDDTSLEKLGTLSVNLGSILDINVYAISDRLILYVSNNEYRLVDFYSLDEKNYLYDYKIWNLGSPNNVPGLKGNWRKLDLISSSRICYNMIGQLTKPINGSIYSFSAGYLKKL